MNGMTDSGLQDGDIDVLLDDTFDYDWLHEIGTGIDDCPLPHHVSSDAEIVSFLERVKHQLSKLPRPSAITVARFFYLYCFTLLISFCHLLLKYSIQLTFFYFFKLVFVRLYNCVYLAS